MSWYVKSETSSADTRIKAELLKKYTSFINFAALRGRWRIYPPLTLSINEDQGSDKAAILSHLRLAAGFVLQQDAALDLCLNRPGFAGGSNS